MRRMRVVFLAVLVVLGGLAAGRVSVAQEATPEATDTHPIVGAWLLDTDTEDPGNNASLEVFSTDGTHFEVDAEGFVSAGLWEATGPNTVDLTFWFLEGEAMGVIRASIEVSADGQSLTAGYTFEFIEADGTSSGEIGPGSASGTKLAVEPQGEPIGTFEEIFGTPVATPAG